MNATTHAVSAAAIEVSASLRTADSRASYWGPRFTVIVLLTWAASIAVGFQVGLTVLTLVGFGATVLGLRRPALGLFGVGILSTIDAPARALLLAGGVLRWNTFNYWLLLVMLLALPFLLRLRDPQTRLLQAFVVLLGLQLFISPSRSSGILHILGIVTLFGLLVYFVANLRDRHVWYWLGIICGITAGAGGLAFFLQIDRLPYVNPNAWAFFPLTGLFAICLAFPFAAEATRGRLTLAILAVVNLAVVNFVWLALSASRGALLIAALCLLFLVLEMRSFTHRIVFLAVGAVLVVAISTQFPTLQAYVLKRVNVLVDPSESLMERTSGRSDLAISGWHIFRRNPLGVGTGGFASEFAKLGDLGGLLTTRRVGVQSPAHSGWIQILAENGIAGIVLLTSYVLSFAVMGVRRAREDRTLRTLGILVSGVIALSQISTGFQNKGLWLFAAGAMVLLNRDSIIRILESPAARWSSPKAVPLGNPHSA